MSDPQEGKKEQKDSTERLPILDELMKSQTESEHALTKYARQVAERIVKRSERLDRERDALDEALIKGTISEEQATKKLEQIRKERQEISEDAHEGVQFIAQLNRDSATRQTLHVNRFMEMHKLDYDFHKHFTTLGTGSILFIAAVVRLIFPNVSETEGLGLLFTSFAVLVLSVIMAALAMKASTLHVAKGESLPITERIADWSWYLFTTGIITFLSYVGINLAGVTIESEWSLPLYVLGGALLGYLLPRIIRSVRSGVHKVWQFASKKRP